jgi:uncharacterized phage infection (PIP) family protein YhgE
MANLETKEIIDKITDKVENKDIQMELLEDITDSFDKKEASVSRKDYDDLQIKYDLMSKKYNDLQDKYISRFSNVQEVIKPIKNDEELEEKKYIDVQSIFR